MSASHNEIFTAHYSILQRYLASYFTSGLSKSKSSAKDKLQRLPMEQFIDVSTDLTDEIKRREENDKNGRILLYSTISTS
jgi:hypothetical protein